MTWKFIVLILAAAIGLPKTGGAQIPEGVVCRPISEDWYRGFTDCPCTMNWKPTSDQIESIRASHNRWLSESSNESSSQAIFCAADLQGRILDLFNLQEADFAFANMDRVHASSANLKKANFYESSLQSAMLAAADFQEATLTRANLRAADLSSANLRQASLSGANLQEANLEQTIVEDAKLDGVNLTRAIYAPVSGPPSGNLQGIIGLDTVLIPYDFRTGTTKISGMMQLQKLARDMGLREEERKATFAIRHNTARNDREYGAIVKQLGGWLQLICFEWTTGWGLYPYRAVLILLALTMLLGFVYAVPISVSPVYASTKYGIFRVWPGERLESFRGNVVAAEKMRVERLTAVGLASFGWGFYFSVLSAFHIPWRDLDVSTWLTRMQFTEFALQGRGWVRFMSGLQSVVSVYLLAIWVLTSFGRPFEW
jgi:uncharacterized protein YjbI with pentapeptide repeats